MRLSSTAFNSFLGTIGQKVGWRRAYACPCINPASGAAKSNCPLCFGKGRQWDVQVNCTAGIGGAKVQRKFAALGLWQAGDVALTIGSDQPIYAIGPFDRVLLVNATVPFSENLTRGAANERFNWKVASITRVFYLDPSGNSNIMAGMPTVNPDGTLTFSAGAPPNSTVYSITGTKQAEYFCYPDLPTNRNEFAGEPLPRNVLLKSFDLYGR